MKNVIRLLALVSILIGLLWMLSVKGVFSNPDAMKSFSISDTSSITSIIISNNTDTTLLIKEVGKWFVDDTLLANPHSLNNLIYTLNKVSVKSPVGKQHSEQIVKYLKDNGVACKVYNGNELLKSYYLGSFLGDSVNTYMVMSNPSSSNNRHYQPYIVEVAGYNGNVALHYTVEELYWRNKQLLQYEEEEIVSIKVVHMDSSLYSFRLKCSDGMYAINSIMDSTNIVNVDTASIEQYLTYFSGLYVENFMDEVIYITDKKVDPLYELFVVDSRGVEQKLVFYPMMLDGEIDWNRWYVVINDEQIATVLVYKFGKLLPEVSYFLN